MSQHRPPAKIARISHLYHYGQRPETRGSSCDVTCLIALKLLSLLLGLLPTSSAADDQDESPRLLRRYYVDTDKFNRAWDKAADSDDFFALRDFALLYPNQAEGTISLFACYALASAEDDNELLLNFIDSFWHKEIRQVALREYAKRVTQAKYTTAADKYIAIADLVLDFPESPALPITLKQLEVAAFEMALEVNTSTCWEQFVESFPHSELHPSAWRECLMARRAEAVSDIARTDAKTVANKLLNDYAGHQQRQLRLQFNHPMATSIPPEDVLAARRTDIVLSQISDLFVTPGISIEELQQSPEHAREMRQLISATTQTRELVRAVGQLGVLIKQENDRLINTIVREHEADRKTLVQGFLSVERSLAAVSAEIAETRNVLNQRLTAISKQLDAMSDTLDSIDGSAQVLALNSHIMVEQQQQILNQLRTPPPRGRKKTRWGAVVSSFQPLVSVAISPAAAVKEGQKFRTSAVKAATKPLVGAYKKTNRVLRDVDKKRLDGQKWIEQKSEMAANSAVRFTKDPLGELRHRFQEDLQFVKQVLVEMFGMNATIGIEIPLDCTVSLSCNTGAYAVGVTFPGGIKTQIDQQTMSDATTGNWTWPQFNLRDTLVTAMSQLAIAGDGYLDELRKVQPRDGKYIVVFASRDFVEWASLETVAKNVAAIVFSAGGEARRTAVEVRQRLLNEAERICSALVLCGFSDDATVDIVAAFLQQQVRAILETTGAGDWRAMVNPRAALARSTATLRAGSTSCTFRLDSVNYWLDYEASFAGMARPVVGVTIPGQKHLDELSKIADRCIGALHLDSLLPSNWKKGRVNLAPHLSYILRVELASSSRFREKIREAREKIATASDSAQKDRALAELQRLEAEALEDVAKHVDRQLERLATGAFRGGGHISDLIQKAKERLLQQADLPNEVRTVINVAFAADYTIDIDNVLAAAVKPHVAEIVSCVRQSWAKDPSSRVIDLTTSKPLVSAVEGAVDRLVPGNKSAVTVRTLTFDLSTLSIDATLKLISAHEFALPK